VAEPPRVVLDANVIVRGLLTPHGGSGRVVRALAEGRFVFVTSESILYEVATILSEPRVQRYGPFPPDEVTQRIDILRRIGVLAPGDLDVSLVPTDAKDNPIVACALEAVAEYIVTDDRRDLLPLKVIRVAGYKPVQIVAPRAFLKSVLGVR
jgi:putative PIN family toxin of toxin-antitoxin system